MIHEYSEATSKGCVDMAEVLISEKDIPSYVKLCKGELKKDIPSSKATAADIEVALRCTLKNNYADVKKTALYKQYSVEYCRCLEIINRMLGR